MFIEIIWTAKNNSQSQQSNTPIKSNPLNPSLPTSLQLSLLRWLLATVWYIFFHTFLYVCVKIFGFFIYITLKLYSFYSKYLTAFFQSQNSKLSNCYMSGPGNVTVNKKNKLLELTFYSVTFFSITACHLV